MIFVLRDLNRQGLQSQRSHRETKAAGCGGSHKGGPRPQGLSLTQTWLRRMPAAVALANKMARTIWALPVRKETCRAPAAGGAASKQLGKEKGCQERNRNTGLS